jgi:hypothetical protein
VSGHVSADTTWNADKVKVVGDVTVENGVTLFIPAGVCVEFQDYYKLAVQGTLLAVGTPERRIVFTCDEPGNFLPDASHLACWNGIRFHDTPSTNDKSRIEYCIIEYSKATDEESDGKGPFYPYGGGAISVHDFSKLVIAHNIIRHNVADHGGALFLYRQACPLVASNLIVNNHCVGNGSAIYCSYSYPRIINNTIVDNPINNQDDPYIDACAVETFLAKPVLINNIVRDNDPDVVYSHFQLMACKESLTHHNNIEDYFSLTDNIDVDPLFVNSADGDYHLLHGSPCRDSGDNGTLAHVTEDVEGDPRDAFGTVDMGADEFHDHLYATGDFTPNGSVTVKFAGGPGTTQVAVIMGGAIFDPPLPCDYGLWYMKDPMVIITGLGPIPGNGIYAVPGTIPATPAGPYSIYLQGVIDYKLTNICILNVE